MALITIQEADNYLDDTVYADWDALDGEYKQVYIENASNWSRLHWQSPSDWATFDWDDDATWDDEAGLKKAIALYSDAAREGLIYSKKAAGSESAAPVKKTTKKVGPLEITTEYAQSDINSVSRNSITNVNDQMLILGFTKINRRGNLVRS